MIKIMAGMSRKLQIGVISLILFAFAGTPALLGVTNISYRAQSVEITGALGAVNSVAFAFGRYALFAPYAPTTSVTEDSPLSQFDNNQLYIVDTKRAEVISKIDLGNCYFPTRVLFDENTQTVFIRGTQFVSDEAGQYDSREAIAHLRLNLDQTDKPFADSTVVVFPIKGRGDSAYTGDAPSEMLLGHKGRILIFTNGASIFTWTVADGYLYPVDFVSINEYSPDNNVSLNIDEATNTLTVTINRKREVKGGAPVYSSVVKFYSLDETGLVDLVKEVPEVNFPQGASLTPGSNVVISPDPKGHPEHGLFVTNDGSLCQVSLRGKELDGTVRVLGSFPSFVQNDPETVSPLFVSYDSSTRLLVMVRKGQSLRISRPYYGRPGRRGGISRPYYVRVTEDSAIAMVRLGREARQLFIESKTTFTQSFNEEGGLSNLVFDLDGNGLISSYSGKLYSITTPADLSQSVIEEIGELGDRIDYITYNSSRDNLIAVNSFEGDGESPIITAPGALIVANKREKRQVPAASAFLQSLLPTNLSMGVVNPSIRRPCYLWR